MDRSHQDPSMIVNCKNQSGFTPLHYASENGHFSIVQCLLRYTMDKNPKNEWGTTPLHYAAVEGSGYLYNFVIISIYFGGFFLLHYIPIQKISIYFV